MLSLERCKSWNPIGKQCREKPWNRPTERSGAKACQSCRARIILGIQPLVAKIGVDTAENRLSKILVTGTIEYRYTGIPADWQKHRPYR